MSVMLEPGCCEPRPVVKKGFRAGRLSWQSVEQRSEGKVEGSIQHQEVRFRV